MERKAQTLLIVTFIRYSAGLFGHCDKSEYYSRFIENRRGLTGGMTVICAYRKRCGTMKGANCHEEI